MFPIGNFWSWQNGPQFRSIFWRRAEKVPAKLCGSIWGTQAKEEKRWSKAVYTESMIYTYQKIYFLMIKLLYEIIEGW